MLAFFFADAIDKSIGGYRVCREIQKVIGTRGKVMGAQILNGLYRIYLSTNEARNTLVAQGVTIGDTYISVIEVNPRIVRGAEESPSVKIIIGNIPSQSPMMMFWMSSKKWKESTSDLAYFLKIIGMMRGALLL